VGVVNTAVDYAVALCLNYLLGVPEIWAQISGYCCGIVCSFILNGRFTFKAKGKILQFIIVNAVSLGISTLITYLLSPLPYWLAKGIVTLITMCINFFGYKLFVYRTKEDTTN